MVTEIIEFELTVEIRKNNKIIYRPKYGSEDWFIITDWSDNDSGYELWEVRNEEEPKFYSSYYDLETAVRTAFKYLT